MTNAEDTRGTTSDHNEQKLSLSSSQNYFAPFVNIIKSKSDILQKLIQQNSGFSNRSIESELNDNEEECKILQEVISIERTAFLSGIATGVLTFASVRYLPNKFVYKFGSEHHIKMLQKSYDIRRKSFRGRIGMFISFGLEMIFGGYVGTLAYQVYHDRMKSIDNDNFSVYRKLGSIPKVVKGNSVLSNELCQDWVKAYDEVPAEFWRASPKSMSFNEAAKTLDARNAIHEFANNCRERFSR